MHPALHQHSQSALRPAQRERPPSRDSVFSHYWTDRWHAEQHLQSKDPSCPIPKGRPRQQAFFAPVRKQFPTSCPPPPPPKKIIKKLLVLRLLSLQEQIRGSRQPDAQSGPHQSPTCVSQGQVTMATLPACCRTSDLLSSSSGRSDLLTY